MRGLASWDGIGFDDYNGRMLQGAVDAPLNRLRDTKPGATPSGSLVTFAYHSCCKCEG
jgi:hypothetical protein